MADHQNRLKNMCRVCGKRPKKYSHNKESDACKSLLLGSFGIDVKSEPKEVYPHLVCNNCYLSMQRINRSKESGIALKSHLTLSSWLPHCDESCLVCDGKMTNDRHQSLAVEGRGRPRNDDITHLSRNTMRAVNSINPPQYSDLSLDRSFFLQVPILSSLLCQHCNCIPNRPLELQPCHHLFL